MRRMANGNGSITADHKLTGEQSATLALLVSGLSPTAVAAQLGLARETVSRWRHHHPVFREEYERQVGEINLESRERLAVLAREALDELRSLLHDEDPRVKLDAIEKVLRGARLLGPASLVNIQMDTISRMSEEEVSAEIRRIETKLLAEAGKAGEPAHDVEFLPLPLNGNASSEDCNGTAPQEREANARNGQ